MLNLPLNLIGQVLDDRRHIITHDLFYEHLCFVAIVLEFLDNFTWDFARVAVKVV